MAVAAIALLCVALAALLPVVSARAATPRHAARSRKTGHAAPTATTLPFTALPPQGIFDVCDITINLSECDQRLGVIAGAGLKLVVVPLPDYGGRLFTYLRAMRAEGLQAIWELNHPAWWGYNGSAPFGYDASAGNLLTVPEYASWAIGCGCSTNAQLLAFIIHTMSASGVTFGWYTADDSQYNADMGPDYPYTGGGSSYTIPQALQGIRTLDATLQSLAPGEPTIVSSWGMTDTTQLSGALGIADIAAQENYPVGLDGAGDSTAEVATETAATAAQTQRLASVAGRPSAFILQSFGWSNCGGCGYDDSGSAAAPPYPSAAEMLAMRNEVLSNADPKVILWFCLQETIGWQVSQTSPGHQGVGWSDPPDPQARLAALTAAVRAPYTTAGR